MASYKPPKPSHSSPFFSSIQDILHRSPRLIWALIVTLTVLLIVVSVLLFLEIFGPNSLQVSSWLGVRL